MQYFIVQLKRVDSNKYFIGNTQVSKNDFDFINSKSIKRFNYNLDTNLFSFSIKVPHQYFSSFELTKALSNNLK